MSLASPPLLPLPHPPPSPATHPIVAAATGGLPHSLRPPSPPIIFSPPRETCTEAETWATRRSRRLDRIEREGKNNRCLLMLLVSTVPCLHRVVMTGSTAGVGGNGRSPGCRSFWKAGTNEPPSVPICEFHGSSLRSPASLVSVKSQPHFLPSIICTADRVLRARLRAS